MKGGVFNLFEEMLAARRRDDDAEAFRIHEELKPHSPATCPLCQEGK